MSRTARRSRLRPVLLSAMAALAVGSAGLAAPAAAGAPPATAAQERQRFIVTVADAHDSRQVAAEHRRNGAQIDFVYTAALNGFAGAMSDADLGALQRDRRVTRIERDGIATASESPQTNPTWGLDRIDQRALPLSTSYSYTTTGSGVNAYIVDTGILGTHTEFTGRLGSGFTSINDGGGTNDCNGHGTHVAGTVGGTEYGVAKNTTLHPVRVLDCAGSGTWSGVVAGLDWVATNHLKPAVANMSLGGGANASVDDAVNRTIASGVSVVVAAGNGNQAGREQDACNYSPARVPAAVTIGATTRTDAKTSWSNYGSCVDLFAPGAGITSAWYTGDTATNTISGTSMAAPHVAGVAAQYLQSKPGATPQQVRDAVYANSTKGIVTSSRTANNHLLFTGAWASPAVKDGTLAGRVTTSSTTEGVTTTTGVEGATVTAGTKAAVTDMNGYYSMSLPPDTYTVTAAASGYDTGSRQASITSETTTTVDFSLALNSAPTASFTFSCTDLACSFDGRGSTDADGTISSYAWAFGDGTTATGSTASRTYAAGDTYSVTLTVTDDDGATGSASQAVRVTAPASSGISLTATGSKVKGQKRTDLRWSNATSGASVTILRDGSGVGSATSAADGSGAHTDVIEGKGGGTYTYKVCESADLTTCSNPQTVTF